MPLGDPRQPGNGLSPSAGIVPSGMVYHSIPNEHLPWGVDTPHNLFPMELHPTAQNNGPPRPQRLVDKLANMGNPLRLFRSYAAASTPLNNSVHTS